MPRKIHQEFHGELYRAMSQAGISKRRNHKWSRHFIDNPQDYHTAISTLYEVSSRFDAKYLGKDDGYRSSLVQRILREMREAQKAVP